MKYNQLIKAIDSASRQLLGRAAVVVNQALVIRNWFIGAYIIEFEQRGEDRAKYGEHLYSRLAADLREKHINGCGERMLQQMAVFYRTYPQINEAIPQPLVAELADAMPAQLLPATAIPQVLKRIGNSATGGCGMRQSSGLTPLSAQALLLFSWTHILELIRLEDPPKRAFYENECLKGNWSKRQLQRQIGSLLYERTRLSTRKAAVLKRARRQEPRDTIANLIRDPYILEFTGLAERPEYHENDLEKALLDHLQGFLLELGSGFCFEARQKRITVANKHNYIDLVFFQRRLRCHVLLDLKVRPFAHSDAGQMNFYLNWWKKHGMEPGDNPPIGILLCSDREKTEVEFATAGLDNRLFVSRYLVALPTAGQLRQFLENDRADFEAAIRSGLHCPLEKRST